MSVENLLFYLEVSDFKTVEAPEYRKALARKIFRKYIKVDAPMGIAVKHQSRLEVAAGWEKAEGNVAESLFDGLSDEVVLSMKLDILPRFVESEQFNKLAALKFEERKVRASARPCSQAAQAGRWRQDGCCSHCVFATVPAAAARSHPTAICCPSSHAFSLASAASASASSPPPLRWCL